MRRREAGGGDDAGRTGHPLLHGPGLATVLLFLANGAVFGAVVPRLPELKDALGLDAQGFGLAMACYPVGALVGGLAAPLLMRRLSDGALAVATMMGAAAAGGLVSVAPSAVVFGLILVLFGICDATTDVAMNAHGIRVQLRNGGSLINRFHAMWSLGAVLGAVVGSVAAGLGSPVSVQVVSTVVVCGVLAVAALPLRLPAEPHHAPAEVSSGHPGHPGHPGRPGRRGSARVWLAILGLGVLACSAELVEDYAQNWAALYLRDVVGVGAGVAGAGFVAIQGAQLLGRLFGDWFTESLGTVRVGWVGGVFVTAGAVAVLLASVSVHGTSFLVVVLLGFTLAGWGIATVIPGAMLACDSMPGLARGVGLTALNWVMRLGWLQLPPAVGFLAQHAGMRWTVAPMVGAGLVIVVLSPVLLGLADSGRRRAGSVP